MFYSSQVYETLEHRLVVAEAAQKLRLPLISKDGEVQEEDIEKWSVMSRSSLDSTGTSATISSSSNSLYYPNSTTNSAGAMGSAFSPSVGDSLDPGVGGLANQYLGITPAYLWQTQLQQMPLMMDMAEYQMSLSHEIETRLKDKCDKLADAFVDDIGTLSKLQSLLSFPHSLPRLITEEIEREEGALREDLYSVDRKFAEYYNVLEQILGVLIKLVKDLKLQHQHKYDELQTTWLCKRCETMDAKLRVLEHVLLLETYTQESIPALHKIRCVVLTSLILQDTCMKRHRFHLIKNVKTPCSCFRKYLIEATEEASLAYNKAVCPITTVLVQQGKLYRSLLHFASLILSCTSICSLHIFLFP
ncbi:unnamed protein product [Linum tenue]|uniref:Uncharacterized protein n=1 Tax=Linum tenue TaxID=586396 RepID=A0AAV0H5A6_9ROSI|nr:unnamed protein product [Linum tenue]